jgi:hypothetical protein
MLQSEANTDRAMALSEKFKDFKLRLWSQKELKSFKLKPNTIAEIYGLHIIHQHGGIFLTDADFECDNLIEYTNKYKFCAFIHQIKSVDEDLRASAKYIAAIPGHKIIHETISALTYDTMALSQIETVYTNCIYKFWQIQGPILCTPSIEQ